MRRFARVFGLIASVGCAAPAASTPSSAPSPGASAPPASAGPVKSEAQANSSEAADKVVADALAVVSRVRGLPIRSVVPGKRLNREQLRAEMVRLMAEDTPPEALRGNAELLFALDTVAWDFDFQATVTELYAGELAGFYDPKKKSMVLAADLPEAAERVALYHELVHALQDQSFQIADAVGWREEASDELAAHHAVLEGDATSAMMDVLAAVQGTEPIRMTPEMLQAESVLTEASPRLALVPSVLKRSMLAPYLDGLGFVLALRDRGGFPEVDRALKERPSSTEQILHVDKFLAKEPVQALPVITGPAELGEITYRDVIGEQGLRIVFEEGMPTRAAVAAASDWGADRLAVFSAGEQRAVRWHLVFDSESAARRATAALARLALRPELGEEAAASSQALRPFAEAHAAELAVQSGRLCQLRPQRGPFALVRRDRHVGVTLGPYRRTRTNVRAAGDCPQALNWADQLARAR